MPSDAELLHTARRIVMFYRFLKGYSLFNPPNTHNISGTVVVLNRYCSGTSAQKRLLLLPLGLDDGHFDLRLVGGQQVIGAVEFRH